MSPLMARCIDARFLFYGSTADSDAACRRCRLTTRQRRSEYGSHVTATGHVWTAPGCQGIEHVAALVEVAMCSAYECGSQGRRP
jgi:hypothetical protein